MKSPDNVRNNSIKENKNYRIYRLIRRTSFFDKKHFFSFAV